MLNRIASILETATVIASLVATAVFTYDIVGTSFSVPGEVTQVAAVSGFSSAPARVAEPKAVRMDVACGENCGADEGAASRAIIEEKAPGF